MCISQKLTIKIYRCEQYWNKKSLREQQSRLASYPKNMSLKIASFILMRMFYLLSGWPFLLLIMMFLPFFCLFLLRIKCISWVDLVFLTIIINKQCQHRLDQHYYDTKREGSLFGMAYNCKTIDNCLLHSLFLLHSFCLLQQQYLQSYLTRS